MSASTLAAAETISALAPAVEGAQDIGRIGHETCPFPYWMSIFSFLAKLALVGSNSVDIIELEHFHNALFIP